MGAQAAMACTVAVEKVITNHYNDQIRDFIADGDPKKCKYILDKFSQFRDDEQHHHDTAQNHEDVEGSKNLMNAVDLICKASIKIAEKV